MTCTKDKGSRTNATRLTDVENNSLALEIEIECWRKSLGLNDNTEILVAFAWAHDYELRKLRMFPEYIAIDGTFEMNRQKRALLTACGLDGEKKTFIGFRFFMPSEQRRVYSWEIGKAMPFLVGESMKFNQVLSCDMEQALVDAIIESISEPHSLLSNSKLRLDFYDMFQQKWAEHVSIHQISFTF